MPERGAIMYRSQQPVVGWHATWTPLSRAVVGDVVSVAPDGAIVCPSSSYRSSVSLQLQRVSVSWDAVADSLQELKRRAVLSDSDSDSVYWICSQKAKSQKAKQTIMHCTTTQYNTRQEMKWNAMQCNGNKMLSYRRETALQGALHFSPKVEDWNWEMIFYGHYRSIFNHGDIIDLKICRIRWKNAK